MGMWAREHQNTLHMLRLPPAAKISTAHADLYFRGAATSEPFSEREKLILLICLSAHICHDCDYVYLYR
jgi:hypothetical protein